MGACLSGCFPGAAAGSKGPGAGGRATTKAENLDFEAAIQFLTREVKLFKLLPKDQHPLLARACETATYRSGEVVIKQGDPGDSFYVVRSGEASVKVSDSSQKVTLKQGDYFGELSLLYGEPRAATITAESALSTFKITREKFLTLGLHEKIKFPNRKAIAGGEQVLETKPASHKTDAHRAEFARALRTNENLQSMLTLSDENIHQLANLAWEEEIESGREIIREGDIQADYFYIVKEGSFEILKMTEEGHDDVERQIASRGASVSGVKICENSRIVTTLGKGTSFGELALLYMAPRAATVKAKSKSVVWVVDRRSFKEILMKAEESTIAENMKHIENVKLLTPLLGDEKWALTEAMMDLTYRSGEVIMKEGDAGTFFCIIYDGEVSVTCGGAEVNRLSASRSAKVAHHFGEHALLQNETRSATITVKSERARVLQLGRNEFNILLGPLQEILSRTKGGKMTNSKKRVTAFAENIQQAWAAPQEKILQKDLRRIGLLGCGGFGAVNLVVHDPTGKSYALKALSKGYVVKTGMQKSTVNEKNILMMTNSVFITKLFQTYNGTQSLYFLLEVALGGELFATYNKKSFHGSVPHAMFYSAGVVFAFLHLHERHIIYRDLKPENLLLTEGGHIKLTDMGLAKFVIGKTFTTCGTPDYFAPELIASNGHNKAVDWWTLGILIFELLSGHPPFESSNPMHIYGKVMKGIEKVRFPTKCQGQAGDLIKGLLQKDPTERIPMKPDGARLLQEHGWYSDSRFDWNKMESLELKPPYVPKVKTQTDVSNFSARQEDAPPQLNYRDDGSGWDKEFGLES